MTKDFPTQCQRTENFINRVMKGSDIALSEPGPTLVIAHGGIHYAFCQYYNIKDHTWAVDHCVLIHFLKEDEQWKARTVT